MYKTKIKTWGLTKYKNRRRITYRHCATQWMRTLESIGSGPNARSVNTANRNKPQGAPHEIMDAPISGRLVLTKRPSQVVVFDQQVEHFLRTTEIYLQFASTRKSWRSIPSLLLPRCSCRNRVTLQRTQATFQGPFFEWTFNAFEHKRCGQQAFFFDDIVTSICYAARRDYQNAGDCWRSAFRSIEAAIDREDPEFLVALMWSVTFLNGTGCGEVVSMLQNYVLYLTSLRANRPDPLLPVLASFAGIHRTRMMWLRGLILDMILAWSTALSREDPSLFEVYSWSSLPGADGAMSIALTSFVDFKSLTGDKTGQARLDGTTYAGQRLIFLARRKQEHGLLSERDKQGRH